MLLCLEFYLEEDVFYSDRDLQDTILQLFKTVKWFRMVRAEQLVNGIASLCVQYLFLFPKETISCCFPMLYCDVRYGTGFCFTHVLDQIISLGIHALKNDTIVNKYVIHCLLNYYSHLKHEFLMLIKITHTVRSQIVANTSSKSQIVANSKYHQPLLVRDQLAHKYLAQFITLRGVSHCVLPRFVVEIRPSLLL